MKYSDRIRAAMKGWNMKDVRCSSGTVRFTDPNGDNWHMQCANTATILRKRLPTGLESEPYGRVAHTKDQDQRITAAAMLVAQHCETKDEGS